MFGAGLLCRAGAGQRAMLFCAARAGGPARRRYSAQIPESDKLSWMLLPTKKTAKAPRGDDDAQSTTDILTKAGYLYQSSAGIYTLMPLAQRVVAKIEAIVDAEMQRVGGQKLAMPSLLAPEHWITTGRLQSTGEELFSFKDRKGSAMLLGPTHEEEVTAIVKDMVRSYRQYPLRLYQTTRKFRDEARPRAGLLRGREFIMKDMYSFDVTKEQAIASFDAVEAAYRRCFDRIGVPYAVADADSGNIGGSLSKEFHFVSGAGEDTLLKCGSCGYTANEERAQSTVSASASHDRGVGMYRIQARQGDQDVCLGRVVVTAGHQPSALKIKQARSGAVHGPLDVVLEATFGAGEERALREALACDAPGAEGALLLVDSCAEGQLLAGWPGTVQIGDWHVAAAGDACAKCEGGRLESQRAIEVGHIFYLGDKYSRALGLTTQHQGQRTPVEMGCYGLGVSRVLQAAAECCNADGRGLRWPLAIAPYLAAIVPLDGADHTATVYAVLTATSIGGAQLFQGQIAVDDRDHLSAGFRLHDAQLLGIPVTVVMGKRFVAEAVVEVQLRIPGLQLPGEIAGAAVQGDGYEHRALVPLDKLGTFLKLALQGVA